MLPYGLEAERRYGDIRIRKGRKAPEPERSRAEAVRLCGPEEPDMVREIEGCVRIRIFGREGMPIITDIRDNGDGTIGWSYSTITVKDGSVMAAPRA